MAYLGFHKGGPNFRWPLVLTQGGGDKPCFQIFSSGEKHKFFAKGGGHGPMPPPPKYATGSDVRPRVDNITSGGTLQDLTRPLVDQSTDVSKLVIHIVGIGASFWGREALSRQQVRIRKETLEFGNHFSGC